MSVSRKVTVDLDVVLIRQLDELAREHGTSRAEVIRTMIDLAPWGDVADALEDGASDG